MTGSRVSQHWQFSDVTIGMSAANPKQDTRPMNIEAALFLWLYAHAHAQRRDKIAADKYCRCKLDTIIIINILLFIYGFV